MANPWLKKNPFMSIWLSAANAAVGAARGRSAAASKRQSGAAIAQGQQQTVDFWTSILTARPKRGNSRRSKR